MASQIETELEVCENESEKLTPWEQSFIISTRDQLDRNEELSARQQGKLHQIYEKVV